MKFEDFLVMVSLYLLDLGYPGYKLKKGSGIVKKKLTLDHPQF